MVDWGDAGALAAGAVAPAALWMLWRGQTASVGALRWAMVRMTRHAAWLYHVVSWFGTLLHELSHATVLLASGHGIKNASVRSETGHVTPRRARRDPLSFLSFLAAAIAPLWIPPALVLLAIALLVDGSVLQFHVVGLGWGETVQVLQESLWGTAAAVGTAFGSLDVTRPAHIAVLALALVAAPGSRPSHVKASRFHGGRDEGDIAVVRRRIRSQPVLFLLFLVGLWLLYFALGWWAPGAYWVPFQALWAVAVTGVLLALFGATVWSIVAWNTFLHWVVRIVPPAMAVAAYVAVRMEWSVAAANAAALGAWAAAVGVLLLVAPRRDKIDRAIRG